MLEQNKRMFFIILFINLTQFASVENFFCRFYQNDFAACLTGQNRPNSNFYFLKVVESYHKFIPATSLIQNDDERACRPVPKLFRLLRRRRKAK